MTSSIVIIALLTGLLGAVVGSFLTFKFQLKLHETSEKRKRKFQIFDDLMKFRGKNLYVKDSITGVDALNSVAVHFRESEQVMKCFDAIVAVGKGKASTNASKVTGRYIDLCTAIANDLYDEEILRSEIDKGFYPAYPQIKP